MIQSFKHKGLSELFQKGNARKVQPKHTKRLNLIENGHACEVDYEDYH
jgi:plasmid maintenance system killer protein